MSEESRVDPRETREYVTEEETSTQIDDLLSDLEPGYQREESKDEPKEPVIEEEKPAQEEEGIEEEAGKEVETLAEEEEPSKQEEEQLKVVEEAPAAELSDDVKAAMAADGVTKTDKEKAPEPSERESALLARVDSLTGLVEDLKKEVAQPTKVPGVTETETKEIDFFGDQDIGNLLDSKEGLNTLLNKVLRKGIELSKEGTLRSIPAIVRSQTTQQSAIREAVKDFYDKNKELLVARKTVGVVMNEVAADNPDWKFDKVLSETATKVYTMLGLKKVVTDQETKTTIEEAEVKPSFAKPSSRKGDPDKKTPGSKLQKDIDFLIN